MKKQFFIIMISLLGISLLSISITKSYHEWISLKTRNNNLQESIEKQKRTLTKLKNNIHIATQIAKTPSAIAHIHASQEREALLRGYIKRGDHIIEIALPPLSNKSPPLVEKNQLTHKNWRVLIIFTYILFIIITLFLFYKHLYLSKKYRKV